MASLSPLSFDCVVCYERSPSSGVVLPCGHTFVCFTCATRLDRCMVCRESLLIDSSPTQPAAVASGYVGDNSTRAAAGAALPNFRDDDESRGDFMSSFREEAEGHPGALIQNGEGNLFSRDNLRGNYGSVAEIDTCKDLQVEGELVQKNPGIDAFTEARLFGELLSRASTSFSEADFLGLSNAGGTEDDVPTLQCEEVEIFEKHGNLTIMPTCTSSSSNSILQRTETESTARESDFSTTTYSIDSKDESHNDEELDDALEAAGSSSQGLDKLVHMLFPTSSRMQSSRFTSSPLRMSLTMRSSLVMVQSYPSTSSHATVQEECPQATLSSSSSKVGRCPSFKGLHQTISQTIQDKLPTNSHHATRTVSGRLSKTQRRSFVSRAA